MRSTCNIHRAVTIGSAACVLAAALAGCGASVSADATATAVTPAASDPTDAGKAEDPVATTRPDNGPAPTGNARLERFIQALQSCRPSTYDERHPLVADFTVVHTVHGKDRDRCEYSQTMPDGMLMTCKLDDAGMADLIQAKRDFETNGIKGSFTAGAPKGVMQQCEFSGEPDEAMLDAFDPPAASTQAAPASTKASTVIHDYVPLPDDGTETTERVGPGVKVIDRSGKVLVDGTQTDWVEVPRQ